MDRHASRVRAIFDEVIQAEPGERPGLITRLCGGDDALRRRIEAMVASAEGDDAFLAAITRADSPAHAAVAPHFAPIAEGPGSRIGPYKLLQLIGEGGFGSVFMAEQEKPIRRRVALKIIKLGMDTRQVIARFEAERQALAMMDHPNIAKVFDAGSTESGRPYFVMELVRGVPVTDYCDGNNVSARERLELFVSICHAVQHAHQKGVIHRDIKPNNILVTLHDGKPVPKVIDFGIAKATDHRLTEKTVFTEFKAMIGTPAYMSPEQAEMSGLDVDTRSDVYSLGVLLYELLTGATPMDAEELRRAGYAEMQRMIREVEPSLPSTRVSEASSARSARVESDGRVAAPGTRSRAVLLDVARRRRTDPKSLSRFIRGDLDWIVMKSLEKDRSRRYDTAAAFAADVLRHVEGEPVLAAPPSAAYRLRKFVRKNKGTVGAFVAVAYSLIVGIIVSTWQWRVAFSQREFVRNRLNEVITESGLGFPLRYVATGSFNSADAGPGVLVMTFRHKDGREMTAFEAQVEGLATFAVENIQLVKEQKEQLEAANARLTAQKEGWERLAGAYADCGEFEAKIDGTFDRETVEGMQRAIVTFEDILGAEAFETVRAVMLLALVGIADPVEGHARLMRVYTAWERAYSTPNVVSLRLMELLGDASADIQDFEQAAGWYRKLVATLESGDVALGSGEYSHWLTNLRGGRYSGNHQNPTEWTRLGDIQAGTVERNAKVVWTLEVSFYASREWARELYLPHALAMLMASSARDAVAYRSIALARYAMEDYAGAMEALDHARGLRERDGVAAHPVELACIAMTQFRLHHEAASRETLGELRGVMSSPWQKSNAIVIGYGPMRAMLDLGTDRDSEHQLEWQNRDAQEALAEAEKLIEGDKGSQ